MLTDALKRMLFASAVLWPVTFPFFLIWLGCLVYLIISFVKNREKRWARIGAGVLVACGLIFAGALAREGRPYARDSAKRLYESHRAAYDTVAVYLLEEGGSYWATSEAKPAEIDKELNEVLTIWSLRCGSPHVSVGKIGREDAPAVLFSIYSGPERDSGDGGTVSDRQYLAYLPNGRRVTVRNQYTESLTALSGDWYLYQETTM